MSGRARFCIRFHPLSPVLHVQLIVIVWVFIVVLQNFSLMVYPEV